MNEDMKLKYDYQETFKEIHAPKALTRKVMNMAKFEKQKNVGSFVKRFALVAAAVAVLFVGSNGVVYAATGNTWVKGIFKDIKNWNGAVIGTEYVQATDEVKISVAEDIIDDEAPVIPVTIEFSNKDMAPFKYLQEVKVEAYKILDEAGEVVVAIDDESITEIVTDGKTQINLPVNNECLIANKAYTLVVESFYGQSKGDQPLEIKGVWECKFIISEN